MSECPDYSSSKFCSLHIKHKFFDADDISEQKIANYVTSRSSLFDFLLVMSFQNVFLLSKMQSILTKTFSFIVDKVN